MTVRNAPDGPLWLQGLGTRQNNAASMRRFLASLFQKAGVLHTGDLAVTASGSPDYHVNVAAGYALVAGTQASDQGLYFDYNDASVQLTIQPANPSLPRLDRVVLVNPDQAYSGTTDDAVLQVVLGTAASSPVLPAAPANSLDLAQVSVAANAANIPQSAITDLRQFASVTAIGNPAGRMYLNADLNVGAGAQAALSPMLQDYVRGGVTFASNGLTVPLTGIYKLDATIWLSLAGGISGNGYIFIYKNGTLWLQYPHVATPSIFNPVSLSTKRVLTAGDTLTLQYQAAGGGTTTVKGGASNVFSELTLSLQSV